MPLKGGFRINTEMAICQRVEGKEERTPEPVKLHVRAHQRGHLLREGANRGLRHELPWVSLLKCKLA